MCFLHVCKYVCMHTCQIVSSCFVISAFKMEIIRMVAWPANTESINWSYASGFAAFRSQCIQNDYSTPKTNYFSSAQTVNHTIHTVLFNLHNLLSHHTGHISLFFFVDLLFLYTYLSLFLFFAISFTFIVSFFHFQFIFFITQL